MASNQLRVADLKIRNMQSTIRNFVRTGTLCSDDIQSFRPIFHFSCIPLFHWLHTPLFRQLQRPATGMASLGLLCWITILIQYIMTFKAQITSLVGAFAGPADPMR
jgi:hypothetical protein